MSAPGEYRNVYGRRPGRGLRPWLLIPKCVCAAVFLGGLASLLVLGFRPPPPANQDDWLRLADVIRRAHTGLIVPALVGALALGVLLALAHPFVFIRMRWLQTKLALIAVCVPALHVYMSHRSIALRAAIARKDFANATLLREQLFHGALAVIAFALAVIILGRLKPRLGQNFARTLTRPRAEPTTNPCDI